MVLSRRKSREFALKALYQGAFHPSKPEGRPAAAGRQALADSFFGAGEYGERERAYGLGLLEDFEKRKSEIDGKIKSYSQNWKHERLSLVDLNIMRIALLEIFYRPGVPGKAALNEALELAKEFGGEDSAGFVNGILDRALRESSKPPLAKEESAEGKSAGAPESLP